jgi:hypothetical protein
MGVKHGHAVVRHELRQQAGDVLAMQQCPVLVAHNGTVVERAHETAVRMRCCMHNAGHNDDTAFVAPERAIAIEKIERILPTPDDGAGLNVIEKRGVCCSDDGAQEAGLPDAPPSSAKSRRRSSGDSAMQTIGVGVIFSTVWPKDVLKKKKSSAPERIPTMVPF